MVYSLLFAVMLLLLTIGVFFFAFQFSIKKQSANLITTTELISDHFVEEIEENEPLSSQKILEEQNNDPYLSIFIYDTSGNMINRFQNFHLNEDVLSSAGTSPVLVFDEGNLLLLVSHSIQEHGTIYGSIRVVQNLQSEASFLKLLGLLLIGANLIGALAALMVGRATSRRMLSPINQMIAATNQIDGGSLDARLDIPEPDDELKSLALTINGMLERVSAAYHQQGRFVADVSHELRTPLSIMQGNVDLLSRWGSEDKAVLKSSIQALQKQTEYMNRLVENLLFLARFDNMQSQLNLSGFSIRDLFSELIEEQSLIDSEHAYSVVCPVGIDRVVADRTMIKQMLRALIDNSVKYTPNNGTICLACSADETTITLSVSDDGVGMDAAHSEHIFERFYRVDQARSRSTGGMGLGLSIVSAIAQAHGGYASVKSELGKGTSISVTIQK